MAKIEVSIKLIMDNGDIIKKDSLLENIAEIGDIMLETEIAKLDSPPPIIRPTNPRVL